MAKYSYITDKSHDNRKIQVESAVRDGEGKNIVNNYSKQNGYYANMGVGQADELSTTRQIENPETACPPIAMGITGGDAEIKTGIENFEYLEGNSFAFNQLVENGNFASSTGWSSSGSGTLSVSSNIITLTISSDNSIGQLYRNIQIVNGHKYILLGFVKPSVETSWTIRLASDTAGSKTCPTNSWTDLSRIVTATTTGAKEFNFFHASSNLSSGTTLQVKNAMAFDITLIYGAGNEPTTVAEFKSRFPLDYYAYNSGTILSAKTNALISRGRQQWDEQWEVGSINNTTGQSESGDTTIRSKNYIPVINGETYYFRVPSGTHRVYYYDANKNYLEYVSVSSNTTFEIPANASYMRFRLASGYGTTYHNDITISIYFEDGEGYDEYYAYSQDSVALPNIELRAIGDLKDIAYASGGGKRRLGYVDLGTLTWDLGGTGDNQRWVAGLTNAKKPVSPAIANIICSKYTADTVSHIYTHTSDKTIGVHNTQNEIWVYDTSLPFTMTGTQVKTAMSGVYLLYELATETELNENTGWDDTINVDNYGTLEFTTSPQQVPQVPQPYFIKYTISLKELLDSIYVNAGGDADDIVYEEELESTVKDIKDGTLVVAKSDLAENLTPYDDESGEEQTQPFALQGTGCGNGESVVDTGSFAQLKEKRGNSVVVNQQVRNGTFTSTTGWTAGGTITASNNVLHFVPSDLSNSVAIIGNTMNSVIGHKYLISCDFKFNNTLPNITVFVGFGGYEGISYSITALNTWTSAYGIVQRTNNSGTNYASIYPRCKNWTSGDSVDLRNFYCIDLTQWFGSNDNIPAYLLAHPEAFFNYYRGSLAYNVGTLTNANGQNLKCIGRNLFDEQWEINSGHLDSKNYIPVSPNTTYYFYCGSGYNVSNGLVFYDINKNVINTIYYVGTSGFTTPSNCCYIKFKMSNDYGTTYNNNITISIYYSGESGYNEYYPYTVLTDTDTGNEILRSAGSVCDIKEPSGEITRKVGTHTFDGALGNPGISFTNVVYYYENIPTGAKSSTSKKAISSMFGEALVVTDGFDQAKYVGCMITNANANNWWFGFPVGTTKEQAETILAGMVINYELAEPTEEDGTPFNETLTIDDFGSMQFDSENYNGVPMGNSIFYPVDYKAMLDSLNNRIDGDVSELMLESDFNDKALAYFKAISGYDATKTQTLKNVNGTLTWVDDE